ncbi:coiled-coil domain-containing protein [Corynebacterium singulare]|uniref:hypothetical protein n=1 Tax=Corynebacterium singulare TaxID=161899 RepID=UPI0011A5FB14|nr:hypothetical protein [Corynebacterium singulare]
MPTPYFVADSAQVTVMRSLASTAFGTYDLTLPEGITLEDLYTLAAPGNKLGYVAALGGERVGGMARRFVRSDVSITTAMGEQEPATNVEEVLDAAAKRTSGDFFLETDISKAGLGPWIPFKDFQVGDKARVEIWGTVVTLPITRIDDDVVHVGGQLVSDADARLAENEIVRRALVDDRRDLFGLDEKIETSVSSATKEWGGRLKDTASSLNDNLNKATTNWNEKLEAQKQEFLDEYQTLDDALQESIQEAEEHGKKLESLTHALQGENQDLDAASRLVLQRIQSLTDTANTAGDWVTKNQGDVNKAIALALSAQGQYNEFNNIKWFKDEEWKKEQVKINQSNQLFQKMQEQVNNLNRVQFIDLYEWRKQVNATKAAQDDINKANDKFKAAQLEYNRINDKLQRYQNRMLERLGGAQKQMAESQSKAVDELMATKAGANRPDASVRMKSDGGWTVNLPHVSGNNLVHVKWYSKNTNNTLKLGGEMLLSNIGSFSVGPEDDYVHIRWTVSSSTVETIDHTTSSTSVPQAEWKTILSAFVSNSGRNLVLDANVTWSAADRGSTYGIRLVVGGTVIGTEQTKELGPETIFGEGERGQAVNGTKTQIRRGDRIELQAYCGAFPGLSRRIKFASMNGTYVT